MFFNNAIHIVFLFYKSIGRSDYNSTYMNDVSEYESIKRLDEKHYTSKESDKEGIKKENFMAENSQSFNNIQSYGATPILEILKYHCLYPDILVRKIIFDYDVVKLDLSNLDLKEIPQVVLNSLSNLQELDLSYNKSLILPKDFKQLRKNLKKLVLRGCNLTAKDLKHIFKSFENLIELDLSEVENLTFPNKLRNASLNIKKLDISSTGFNFKKLVNLKFQSLEELRADCNDFGDIPQGARFPSFNGNLKKLSLGSSHLTLNGLESLTRLELKYLDISNNGLFDRDFERFNNYRNNLVEKLKNIYYEDTNKGSWFGGIKKLYSWSKEVANSKFLGLCVKKMHRPSSAKNYMDILGRFWFYFYALKTIDPRVLVQTEIPEDFSMNALSKSLQVLKINNCLLNPKNLHKIISELENINILSANFNLLSDAAESDCFKHVSKTVVELSMDSCALNNSFFSSLKNFQKLKKLSLNGNSFYDLSKSHINWGNTCKTLRSFNLENCGLEGRDIYYLSRMLPHIQNLNISKNNLNSSLKFSDEWKISLLNLEAIGCELCDISFKEIISCKKLKSLNIKANPINLVCLNSRLGYIQKSLKVLSCTSYGDTGCRFAKQFCLEELHLDEGFIQENFNWGNLKSHLKKLTLSEVGVDIKNINSLRDLKELVSLEFENCHITNVTNIKESIGFPNNLKSIKFNNSCFYKENWLIKSCNCNIDMAEI